MYKMWLVACLVQLWYHTASAEYSSNREHPYPVGVQANYMGRLAYFMSRNHVKRPSIFLQTLDGNQHRNTPQHRSKYTVFIGSYIRPALLWPTVLPVNNVEHIKTLKPPEITTNVPVMPATPTQLATISSAYCLSFPYKSMSNCPGYKNRFNEDTLLIDGKHFSPSQVQKVLTTEIPARSVALPTLTPSFDQDLASASQYYRKPQATFDHQDPIAITLVSGSCIPLYLKDIPTCN